MKGNYSKKEIEEAKKDPKKKVIENADGSVTILEKLEG